MIELARLVGMIAMVAMLSACAATVTCPPVEGESRAVYLLDHGDHASLVIERADAVFVRYSYGDKRWYADGETGLASGIAALFTRTDAVMTRREMNRPDGHRFVVANRYELKVEATRARALMESLDGIFYTDPERIWFSEVYNLEFAPHPEPYTMNNNSNHMVAAWLVELGCTSTGNPLTSNWVLRSTP